MDTQDVPDYQLSLCLRGQIGQRLGFGNGVCQWLFDKYVSTATEALSYVVGMCVGIRVYGNDIRPRGRECFFKLRKGRVPPSFCDRRSLDPGERLMSPTMLNSFIA